MSIQLIVGRFGSVIAPADPVALIYEWADTPTSSRVTLSGERDGEANSFAVDASLPTMSCWGIAPLVWIRNDTTAKPHSNSLTVLKQYNAGR